MPRYLSCLVLWLLCIAVVDAAAPSRLGYQGRLANASGLPITANLNISFRLYDVASGGAVLWSETQSAVPVDGGNLAVELGAVTPLPSTIWGRQLYLGIQVAGDAEMVPRPALTAAPFALRAAGTKVSTIVVSAEGTRTENGAALLAALPRLAGASALNPMVLELDAGLYDLGNQRLNLPSFVTLIGAGQNATIIDSSFANGTLLLASDSHVRRLTARNTGIPPTDNDYSYGIGAGNPNGGRAGNVSLENVTGESSAAPGTTGARHGIYFCTINSRLVNVTGRGEGGNYSFGIRADCGNALNAVGPTIDGLTLFASGGALGVRGGYFAGGGMRGVGGAYLAGGGPWNNIKVFVQSNTTADSVYGIRVFHSALGQGATLVNPVIAIGGDGSISTKPLSLVDGLRIEGADILVDGGSMVIEDVRVQNVTGARINYQPTAQNPAPKVVSINKFTMQIKAMQVGSLGFGGIYGIRAVDAAPRITQAKIDIECSAGSGNRCQGVARDLDTALQPGELVLDQVSLQVSNVDPADASANTIGYRGEGAARIVGSTIRVLRSADAGANAAVSTFFGSSDIRVLNSTLEVLSPSPPATSNCTVAGSGGAIEVFSSHLDGSVCVGAAALTCAGNTRRGAGFLASSCQ